MFTLRYSPLQRFFNVSITYVILSHPLALLMYSLVHHIAYEDSLLVYLPLAHVLEFIMELLVMAFVTTPRGYGGAKTFLDAAVWNYSDDAAVTRKV